VTASSPGLPGLDGLAALADLGPGPAHGGCHCGRVRFAVRGRPQRVFDCNCSLCAMTGFVHWIVPRGDFAFVDEEAARAALALYTFNTGVAKHYFCRHCGVKSFYVPRSDPDKLDVNARCLREVGLDDVVRVPFDGQNWEAHYQGYRRDERGEGEGGPDGAGGSSSSSPPT
jgi:hypothetical protein